MRLIPERRVSQTWVLWAARIAVLTVMLVLMVWVRAFWGSREAYQQAETYFRNKQYILAITFFDRALHWYTPLNPYVERSAKALWEISELAERKGDSALALVALSALRSGFKGAHTLFTPGTDWVRRCEDRMEKLLQIDPAQRDAVAGPAMRAAPDRGGGSAPSPDPLWTLVLEIGFLGWIGTVIAFCVVRLKKGAARVKPVFSSLLKWTGLFLAFYAMWIAGMLKA